MPDKDGNATASEEELPQTSLHAYKEGRKEDVSGDADALETNDPQEHSQDRIEGEDELPLPHEKH